MLISFMTQITDVGSYHISAKQTEYCLSVWLLAVAAFCTKIFDLTIFCQCNYFISNTKHNFGDVVRIYAINSGGRDAVICCSCTVTQADKMGVLWGG